MSDPQFLPAHRKVAAVLTAGLAAFAAWAFLGELDIVATAQGKLVPLSFIKVSQPVEGGAIRRVLVKDGETVEAGQALVEMDPLVAQKDAQTSRQEVQQLKLRLLRVEAERSGKPLDVPIELGADPALQAAVFAEYAARRQALTAALAEAQAAQARTGMELEAARERLESARKVAPMAAEQASMLEHLEARGFVARPALLDKTRARVEAEQDVKVQTRSVAAGEAALAQAQQAVVRIQEDYRRQLAQERSDAQARLLQLEPEVDKRDYRAAQTVLRATAAGTVNGLASHSPGQVLPAGATVLTLVPAAEPLRFEGWVRNEDAGFVVPGMPAKVKFAAFPFQKYGWVEGSVEWLGVDAETPEAMKNAAGEPLFYRVRVSLPRQALARDGETFALKPGMQAVADVELGRRSLFEYLTSPVRKTLLEAARER